jgi:hypothetical protein
MNFHMPMPTEAPSCAVTDPVPFSPVAFLYDLRMDVSETFYYDGPKAALVAVANASMMLAPLIDAGELSAAVVWDMLQEVSENLTLIRIFGLGVIQEAMAFGPRIYAAYRRRPQPCNVELKGGSQ